MCIYIYMKVTWHVAKYGDPYSEISALHSTQMTRRESVKRPNPFRGRVGADEHRHSFLMHCYHYALLNRGVLKINGRGCDIPIPMQRLLQLSWGLQYRMTWSQNPRLMSSRLHEQYAVHSDVSLHLRLREWEECSFFCARCPWASGGHTLLCKPVKHTHTDKIKTRQMPNGTIID